MTDRTRAQESGKASAGESGGIVVLTACGHVSEHEMAEVEVYLSRKEARELAAEIRLAAREPVRTAQEVDHDA